MRPPKSKTQQRDPKRKLGPQQPTVEARKLEHHYPHALKVKYGDSQPESSHIHVPTFWGSLYSKP